MRAINRALAGALYPLLLTIALLTFSRPLWAGGLDAGTTAATDFRDWFATFVGVAAGVYLLYRGIMAWSNKIQWIDFGSSVAMVAVTGGAIVLADWAYGVFA